MPESDKRGKFRAMADAGGLRRSRRSLRRCEHVSPTLLRAALSPTVALLLVASLLPDHIVTCSAVAQRGAVQHMQHGCCWQVLVPVGHEQLHHGPLGPGRLARRARYVLVFVGEV